MKKIVLAVILALPLTVSAQQWYLGVKAGPTFSNYKAKTPWKEVMNTGFNFGVTSYRQLHHNLGVNLEFQYIQKGYFHKVCNTIADKLQAAYLEIPVMIDYTFIVPGLRNFKGHANLGFYTAYWVSAKYKMEGFDASSENFDFSKNNAKRFDFGPNGGARIEYLLKSGSLSLDVRYDLGVLDLQNQPGDHTHNSNRAVVLGLSYLKML
jgi:hypothetical protein